MNTVRVKIEIPGNGTHREAVVPVAIPELEDVNALAQQLHSAGREYSGVAWGWPVQYDPELREDAAEFQVPDGKGGIRVEIRPYWSPASFTIGESGIWFYSLLWENGTIQAPVEFLDDRALVAQE